MMSLPEVLIPRAPQLEVDAPMSAEWLSVMEAAKRLNLHTGTIYKHLHDGTLPCEAMKVGRVWRIKAADVDGLRANLQAVLRSGDTAAMASILTALVEGP